MTLYTIAAVSYTLAMFGGVSLAPIMRIGHQQYYQQHRARMGNYRQFVGACYTYTASLVGGALVFLFTALQILVK